MTAAVRTLIKMAQKYIGKDPERLAKIDDFVKETLPAGEASVYRNKVHGEIIPEGGVESTAKPKIDSEFAEEDTTLSFQKPDYDATKNIPEGNIRTGPDPKLEPPENLAGIEADEKARRSRWKRKNVWGATTGDPFKEMFGKNLSELTKENPDIPFMYRHILEQSGGDHNKALEALSSASKKLEEAQKAGRKTERDPKNLDDIFQIAAQPQNQDIWTDRAGDLDWKSVREEMERVPELAGETAGQKQDSATYRSLLGRADSGDYDPSQIPQNRMTEGFKSGEKVELRKKGGEPIQPVNPREQVWGVLESAGQKQDMTLDEMQATQVKRMGTALAGEFLEKARTSDFRTAFEEWGQSMQDINNFLKAKEARKLPMTKQEKDLRSFYLRLNDYVDTEYGGVAPGEGHGALMGEMERVMDNPWRRYYRGDGSEAKPYSERRQATGKAWEEWNKSPMENIDEEALVPDPQKTGFLQPKFADTDSKGESLQLARQIEEELGLPQKTTKEPEFADQGFQRDTAGVFEGKVASIPRKITADPDDPLQAVKAGTSEGQAYDLGGELPQNLGSIKVVLDRLAKGEEPQQVLSGLNLVNRQGKDLIKNPEAEVAVSGKLLQMLDTPEGMDELIKIFEDSPDVLRAGEGAGENQALRSSGLGRYVSQVIRAARSQDPKNIKANKLNPEIEAHNTFMEGRAKSAAARGEREYSQLGSEEIVPKQETTGSASAGDDTVESIRTELENQLSAKGGGKTRPQIDDRDQRAQARKIVSLIDKNPEPEKLVSALKESELAKIGAGQRIIRAVERQSDRFREDAYSGLTGPELHGRVAEGSAQKDLAQGRKMQKGQISDSDKGLQKTITDAEFDAEAAAARGEIHPIAADREGYIAKLKAGMGKQKKGEGRQLEQPARAELEGTAPMRGMGEATEFETGAQEINQMLPLIKQLVEEGKLTTEGGEALAFATKRMEERGGDASGVANLMRENLLRGKRSVADVGTGPIGESSKVTLGDIANVPEGDYAGRVVGEPPQARQIAEEFSEAGEDQINAYGDMYGGDMPGSGDSELVRDFLRGILLPVGAGGAVAAGAGANPTQAAQGPPTTGVDPAQAATGPDPAFIQNLLAMAHQIKMEEETARQNQNEKDKGALYNLATIKQMNEFRP